MRRGAASATAGPLGISQLKSQLRHVNFQLNAQPCGLPTRYRCCGSCARGDCPMKA